MIVDNGMAPLSVAMIQRRDTWQQGLDGLTQAMFTM